MDIFDELMGGSTNIGRVDTKDVIICLVKGHQREYHVVARLTPTANYQNYFVGYCNEIKQFIVLDEEGTLIKDDSILTWAMDTMKHVVKEECSRKTPPPIGVL